MHPNEHYETIRREREELLKRAEYERTARKAMVEQGMNSNIQQAANWLGTHLVSLGEKLEHFGLVPRREPAQATTTRVDIHSPSKMSPHH